MVKSIALLALLAVAVAAAVLATPPPARAAAPQVSLGCSATGPAASRAPWCADARPMPSLEPAATQRLWRRLTRVRRPLAISATQDCRALRAVFYAATDWLRLATKLAAQASPCADYLISIPPLAGDKTQPRADQAWRIRALCPRFHALAEVHMTGWAAWVAANGRSWVEAGAEARRRIAAAGYDVSLGDAWALNELSSAVRRGDGTARADARAFVRGLYDGGGTLPPARGAVFVTGIGQGTRELATYQARLQGWLQDAPFWDEMNTYVSDWSQELYGDFRNYAVPGASLAARRDALNAYLQHELLLAQAGPAEIASARAFLRAAYNPLANAAWQWDSAFGWTLISAEQMKDYVSAQVYALRHAAAGAAVERWGFAWAPRNGTAMTADAFAAQSGEILDRLAAAIRDSADGPGDDPGARACGPQGQNVWCAASIDGAWFNDGWNGFRAWGPSALVFTTPPQTVPAAMPTQPLAVQLQTLGVPQDAPAPLAVTLASSSAAGAFSTSPAGPWTSTVTVTVPAGATTSPGFLYSDALPGTPTITATAPGVLPATQSVTVTQPAGGGGGGDDGSVGQSSGPTAPVAADLSLSGSVAPASAPIGGTLMWRLHVDANTAVSGVYLELELSDGIEVGSTTVATASRCSTLSPSRLRCELGLPGTVVVGTSVTAAGTHTVTATAGFAGTELAPADNTLTLRAATPRPSPPTGVRRRGGRAAEVLFGGRGADVLLGLGGNDVLRGGRGGDTLDGGPGADVLTGGPGRDRLFGRAGNDVVHARDRERDTIDCGAGRDRVVADRVDRVRRGCELVSRR